MRHQESGMEQSEPVLLLLRNVKKQFPGVLALDGVNFDVRAGEVHALCGENGAGKSTLMKVISGQYQPDGGEIHYLGEQRHFASPLESEHAGIAIIHQELNLVPHLSVAENIFLAREPKRGLFIDRAMLKAKAQEYLDRLGLEIKPDTLVKNLSVAQQQMVEIAKALSLNAKLLIMDEPTSSLTESETVKLFSIIHELRKSKVGLIYISHRLDELAKICDRVTVMRDGRYVSTDRFADITIDDIVTKMVGRALTDIFPPRTSTPTDETLLTVKNLTRKGVFENVSFTLKRGEILGFSGLMGAGRTEVARAIFGADRPTSGTVHLGDIELNIGSPVDAINHGIAYLSENRKHDGVLLKMNVAQNITLANMKRITNRFGFINFKAEEQAARDSIKALGIRTPDSSKIVKLLSGGNQQKIVISKWLFCNSQILFFDEPTRGIDVGAKYAIYQLLDQLASQGIGVVMISSELPEILGMTDRVAVFHEGKLMQILDTKRTCQEEIMQAASGRKIRASDVADAVAA